MINSKICLSMALASLALLTASPARADNMAQPPGQPTVQPAVQPTAQPAEQPATASAASPLLMPAMAGPLGLDTTPYSFDAGPLNKIYVSGVGSAMLMAQTHPVTGDQSYRSNVTNAQVFIQNTQGPMQFYLQGGAYELPALGTPYLRTFKTVDNTYGYLPQGYLKFVPNSQFSIEAGKLPTLIGDEYTFTFQNMNIERGLLWGQENKINRGVQGNYTVGPLAMSLSLNDGFYSGHYNWVTGVATYALDSNDSVAIDAGGALSKSDRSSFVTPEAQNNGSVFNLLYTHTDGPWTYNPYLQYTHTPQDTTIGLDHTASTYGAAFLTKYSFDQNYSMAARAEYIDSIGNAADGAPNLTGYGPGSRAFSLTVTPTYQLNMFFGRLDASLVHAIHTADGDAFAPDGDEKSQGRLMLEAGISF